MKTAAFLISECEATNLMFAPFKLFKETFYPGNYTEVEHIKFSEPFQQNFKSRCLLIDGYPIFAIIFEDGSRYDHGGLKKITENYIDKTGLANIKYHVKKKNIIPQKIK